MTNKFVFEDFPVYKDSLEFNIKIQQLIENIPVKGNHTIIDQLTRAAMSIVLNIAEGAGRYQKGDKRSFYVNARGSTYECAACFQILKGRNLISVEEYDNFYSGTNEIARQLSAMIKS